MTPPRWRARTSRSRASSPRATPTAALNGYVIQTPGYDPEDDATPDASDAVFVYFGSTAGYPIPEVGDHVTILNGRVSEFSGITEVTVTNGAFVETRAAEDDEVVTPGTLIPGNRLRAGRVPHRSGARRPA